MSWMSDVRCPMSDVRTGVRFSSINDTAQRPVLPRVKGAGAK